jgi:uncharacterized OsmC-like protein
MDGNANITGHRIRNGVDVTALEQTLAAVAAKPTLGEFRFRAENRWLGGSLNRSSIRSFYGAGREDDTRTAAYRFDNDEPAVLLGQDRGANPVEFLLHALAGCMTTTMVYHAAARGIEIKELESRLEGDIDIRGFTGIADDVPKGYREVRVKFRARTEGDPKVLEALARMSPVYNTIAGSVPVKVEVETY